MSLTVHLCILMENWRVAEVGLIAPSVPWKDLYILFCSQMRSVKPGFLHCLGWTEKELTVRDACNWWTVMTLAWSLPKTSMDWRISIQGLWLSCLLPPLHCSPKCHLKCYSGGTGYPPGLAWVESEIWCKRNQQRKNISASPSLEMLVGIQAIINKFSYTIPVLTALYLPLKTKQNKKSCIACLTDEGWPKTEGQHVFYKWSDSLILYSARKNIFVNPAEKLDLHSKYRACCACFWNITPCLHP